MRQYIRATTHPRLNDNTSALPNDKKAGLPRTGSTLPPPNTMEFPEDFLERSVDEEGPELNCESQGIQDPHQKRFVGQFLPSQGRVHPVLIYLFPEDRESCYEFSWKRSNKKDGTEAYICIDCDAARAFARKNPSEFNPVVVNTIMVVGQEFLCDPQATNHVCTSWSTPHHLMNRKLLEVGNQPRGTSDRRTPAEIRREVAKEINKDAVFKDLTLDQKRTALSHMQTGVNGNGEGNFARLVQRNRKIKRNEKDWGTPGRLNPRSACDPLEQECFLIVDEPDFILLGSYSLMRSSFASLAVEAIVGDGRFKQTPKSFNQVYTLHFLYSSGHTTPFMMCFLQDATQSTYQKLFRALSEGCVSIGCSSKLETTILLLDFEKAALNAAAAELKGPIHGCYFHYTQAIQTHKRSLGSPLKAGVVTP